MRSAKAAHLSRHGFPTRRFCSSLLDFFFCNCQSSPRFANYCQQAPALAGLATALSLVAVHGPASRSTLRTHRIRATLASSDSWCGGVHCGLEKTCARQGSACVPRRKHAHAGDDSLCSAPVRGLCNCHFVFRLFYVLHLLLQGPPCAHNSCAVPTPALVPPSFDGSSCANSTCS